MTSLTARQLHAGSPFDDMIDLFALGLTHALMALAAWRLIARADLDREGGDGECSAQPHEAGPGDD